MALWKLHLNGHISDWFGELISLYKLGYSLLFCSVFCSFTRVNTPSTCWCCAHSFRPAKLKKCLVEETPTIHQLSAKFSRYTLLITFVLLSEIHFCMFLNQVWAEGICVFFLHNHGQLYANSYVSCWRFDQVVMVFQDGYIYIML